jgi:hypothetical protein
MPDSLHRALLRKNGCEALFTKESATEQAMSAVCLSMSVNIYIITDDASVFCTNNALQGLGVTHVLNTAEQHVEVIDCFISLHYY